MIVALILCPAAIIAPAPTYRGHDACIAAGRAASTRGQARVWACVSVRSRPNPHRDDRGGALWP